jgi:hypothetical protein
MLFCSEKENFVFYKILISDFSIEFKNEFFKFIFKIFDIKIFYFSARTKVWILDKRKAGFLPLCF